MKAELNRVEIEIYRSRSDRNPTNLGLEVRAGSATANGPAQYHEAIQFLQLARGDTKRKALVHLELGECFQKLKQYPLALNNFEAAIEATSERESRRQKARSTRPAGWPWPWPQRRQRQRQVARFGRETLE